MSIEYNITDMNKPEFLPQVPYVPSNEYVVRKMLEITNVTPEDIVYDLGCGDGRILIRATKEFNAKKAVGIEIDEDKVNESIKNIKQNNVEDKVKVIKGDFFNVDISEASVVTLFLKTSVNEFLSPKLKSELRPGTRIVSHESEIPGWKPKDVVEFEDDNGMTHRIYLYLV